MIVPSLGGDDPTVSLTLSPASSISTDTDSALLLSSKSSASVGRNFLNSATASAVLCRLNASMYRPEMTKNVKKTTESKYVVVKLVESVVLFAPRIRRATDEKYAMEVPSDILLSDSIWIRDYQQIHGAKLEKSLINRSPAPRPPKSFNFLECFSMEDVRHEEFDWRSKEKQDPCVTTYPSCPHGLIEESTY